MNGVSLTLIMAALGIFLCAQSDAPGAPPMFRSWEPEGVGQAYKALLGQLEPGKDGGYTLHVANALWGQEDYPWLKEFLEVTKDNYGAALRGELRARRSV